MRFKLPISVLLIALIGFIACKKEENFTSRIYFMNGALGFPALTIKSDSLSVFTNITYDSILHTQVTPSGTRTLSFFTSGRSFFADTTNLESGAIYVSMLFDTVGSTKLYIRKDALPTIPDEGRCKIRFFNMIKGSTNLVLANKIAVPKDSFQYYSSAGSFANFASGSTFTEMDTFPSPSIRVDTLHAVTTLPAFRSRKIYSIYLIGHINDTITGSYKPRAIIQVHN